MLDERVLERLLRAVEIAPSAEQTSPDISLRSPEPRLTRSRCPSCSRCSRAAVARSSSPSATSVSMWSAWKRRSLGSFGPMRSLIAAARSKWTSAASTGRRARARGGRALHDIRRSARERLLRSRAQAHARPAARASSTRPRSVSNKAMVTSIQRRRASCFVRSSTLAASCRCRSARSQFPARSSMTASRIMRPTELDLVAVLESDLALELELRRASSSSSA